MIRCHLSTLMGRHKLKIADVSRETGLNRSTVSALYRESAVRVDMEAIDRLCKLFRCKVGELLEFVNSEPMSSSVSRGRRRAS
ncbi:MAG: helix-turn-helix domain-containing protein [Gammaproteobacteria bacterium]